MLRWPASALRSRTKVGVRLLRVDQSRLAGWSRLPEAVVRVQQYRSGPSISLRSAT